MKTQTYNLEDSLGYVIGHARRAIVNHLNSSFEGVGHNITCEQWGILNNLGRKNDQSQKELSCATAKDKTSVTRLIDGLEKRGLAVRISSKKDARHNLVHLTAKGKKLQQKLLTSVKKTLMEAQREIAFKDLEVCKNVLRRVAQNLS